MFGFWLWNLYFYSDGPELEELQAGRHLLGVSKIYTSNPPDSFIFEKKMISLVTVRFLLGL